MKTQLYHGKNGLDLKEAFYHTEDLVCPGPHYLSHCLF
jgi:hypothetical protein